MLLERTSLYVLPRCRYNFRFYHWRFHCRFCVLSAHLHIIARDVLLRAVEFCVVIGGGEHLPATNAQGLVAVIAVTLACHP